MKKLILLFFLFSFAFSKAQNLVPNPSFEDTLGCPQFYPDLDTKCKFWQSFRYSPDYMNDCSSVCGYYNQYGYQQPNSGKAYAGFGAYQTTIPDLREHIGVQLISPLTIGVKYYITFYVSAAFNVQMNIACNKIGALVTTYQYNDASGSNPLPNSCTIKTDSIVKDTIAWKKISGSFVADSAYQYLIIGNFFDDANTDTLHFPDLAFGYYVSYYYLDDVCLTTDSLYAATWLGIPEQPIVGSIMIFPNPSDDVINLKCPEVFQEIEIFNMLGQKMYSEKMSDTRFAKISVRDFPSGSYILRVKNKQNYLSKIINIYH